MKKRLFAILLTVVILIPMWCTETINASELPSLSLYFVDNEAHCIATVRGSGNIDVNMALWHGNSEVFSWNASNTIMVRLDKVCDVIPGYTYTLKLNGTIGGIAFQEVSVTRTNYEMNK